MSQTQPHAPPDVSVEDSGTGDLRVRTIGVLFGGRSSEREISLETGRNIFHTLDPSRFEAVPLYMDRAGRIWRVGLPLLLQNTTQDIEDRLASDAERVPYEDLTEVADFVYIALHGKYGEDGCVQGLLELLDVPYSGSGVLASALGMDKAVQRRLLGAAGLDVPRHVVIRRRTWAADPDYHAEAIEALGLPAVVKPAREGCSTGLAVVREAGELTAAVDAALAWDNTALVEEMLSGTEVTVAVLDGEPPVAYPPTETPPQSDFLTIEEKFLPGHGKNITPARLSPEDLERVKQAAVEAFGALGLAAYARMDMYVTDDGRVVIGEPNTLPGSTPSSTIFLGPIEEGISPTELLSRVVDASVARHATKKGPLA